MIVYFYNKDRGLPVIPPGDLLPSKGKIVKAGGQNVINQELVCITEEMGIQMTQIREMDADFI
ncbi:MAG: hypothetical protein LIP06_02415 [Tannerellaceae bacterium]|nr:hypothetical protein [Tannerellaceae bacterium]